MIPVIKAVLLATMFISNYSFGDTKVFVANSYHEDFFWTQDIINSFKSENEKLGIKNLSYEFYYLNAFQVKDEEKLHSLGDEAVAKIKTIKPDFVICTDDDAIKHICLKIKDIPVVFNGSNGPEEYLSSEKINSLEKPGHNITGIFQTTYFIESMNLLKRVFPNARTFGVLGDKTTTTSKQLLEVKEKKEKFGITLKNIYISDKKSDWDKYIRKLNNEVDLVLLLNGNEVRNEKGALIPFDEVYRFAANSLKIPAAATWDGPVSNGVLMSAADSAISQGVYTARYLHQIIDGKKPGDLPITSPPSGFPVLNLKTANRLKLKIPPEIMEIFIESGRIYQK